MLSDSALQAFSHAAGLSAMSLSLCLRTAFLSGFFIWAAWCVLELMKHYKNHPHASLGDLFNHYIQLFFLISIVVALVFIS